MNRGWRSDDWSGSWGEDLMESRMNAWNSKYESRMAAYDAAMEEEEVPAETEMPPAPEEEEEEEEEESVEEKIAKLYGWQKEKSNKGRGAEMRMKNRGPRSRGAKHWSMVDEEEEEDDHSHDY